MTRVDDVLRAAWALSDPTSPEGHTAREAAVAECALAPAMADRVFALACARYTPDAVGALLNDSPSGERVGVVLAASVATAALRAVALPWLAGAATIVARGSRRQRALVQAIVRAFGRPEITSVDEAPRDVDRLIAYGGDETLATIAGALGAGVVFEGHGHGFGIAYVRDPSPEVARAVALDVALYDQRGCLSPQSVFVRGDAVAFAMSLHEALEALEATLPRGRVDVGEAAAVVQWQGVMAARSKWFRRGRAHSVGALDLASLAGSLGLRNVTVSAVAGVDEVRSIVGDNARYVTCVGVSDGRGDAWAFTAARVVPVGTMQDPALDGPEDRRSAEASRHPVASAPGPHAR